jgi:shikimate dehydrogenase
MHRFGLVGKKLNHSKSPAIFDSLFKEFKLIEGTYNLFEIPHIQSLKSIILKHKPNGLNVTIPYKSSVIPLLNELTTEAKLSGAVNCIRIIHEKQNCFLIGHNTDILGINETMNQIPAHHLTKKCIVIGNGGASASVQFVLKKKNIQFIVLSRRTNPNTLLLNDPNIEWENAGLIIQTTEQGMWPNIHCEPEIPYHRLNPNTFAWDLIYNPSETQFMKKSSKQGCTSINGEIMLLKQAEESLHFWLNP